MILYNTFLYNSNATVILVAVFGLVCLVLIGFLVKFMTGGDTKTKDASE
ncbi:hypothetical protein SAMN04515667_1741 [Formosa sp. Hel1_31_208]|nr:hypothetical protein [Formosa sp. Hel1_31_208]SDS24735.1 hypothetical protein SAMN04515667_1741 [Formosa sp. Hel1_31_208]